MIWRKDKNLRLIEMKKSWQIWDVNKREPMAEMKPDTEQTMKLE